MQNYFLYFRLLMMRQSKGRGKNKEVDIVVNTNIQERKKI